MQECWLQWDTTPPGHGGGGPNGGASGDSHGAGPGSIGKQPKKKCLSGQIARPDGTCDERSNLRNSPQCKRLQRQIDTLSDRCLEQPASVVSTCFCLQENPAPQWGSEVIWVDIGPLPDSICRASGGGATNKACVPQVCFDFMATQELFDTICEFGS